MKHGSKKRKPVLNQNAKRKISQAKNIIENGELVFRFTNAVEIVMHDQFKMSAKAGHGVVKGIALIMEESKKRGEDAYERILFCCRETGFFTTKTDYLTQLSLLFALSVMWNCGFKHKRIIKGIDEIKNLVNGDISTHELNKRKFIIWRNAKTHEWLKDEEMSMMNRFFAEEESNAESA